MTEQPKAPPIAVRADDVYAAELAARFPARAVEADAPTHRDEECAASSRAYEAELTALRAERDKARVFARDYNDARRERDEASAALAVWTETAAQESRNTEYYRGLLDQIANAIGDEAFIADDGTCSESPLRAKLPRLVAEERERSKVYERLMHSAARALMEQGDRLPEPTGYVHPSGHSEHLAGGINATVRL